MKRALLISVAAIALAAGGQAAFSQGGGGKGGPGPAGAGASGGATINANPSGGGASGAATGGGNAVSPSTGGTSSSTPSAAANDTPNAEPPSGNKAPAARTGQSEKGEKGKQPMKQGQSEQGKQPMQQGQAEHEKGSRQGANERNEGGKRGASETTTKQGASESTTTTKQGSNERTMTSKNVSLTTEQKTTIREKVLTSSAPRVTNVNFDIKIGTVVPRSVRVAPLPPTLITIEPEWRGYMYFVYNDEIIVVNPRTLEIVAVLEV